MTLVASRITDKVMMEFNDEYKRKMADKDEHTVKDDESLHNLVQKLELEMVVIKEWKGVLLAHRRFHRGVVAVEGAA